jgi:hypothetical protein
MTEYSNGGTVMKYSHGVQSWSTVLEYSDGVQQRVQ